MPRQKSKTSPVTGRIAVVLAIALACALLCSTPSHAILVDDSAPVIWGFDVGTLLATNPLNSAWATLTLSAGNPLDTGENLYIRWLDEISDPWITPSFSLLGPNTSVHTTIYENNNSTTGTMDNDIYLAAMMKSPGQSIDVTSVSLTELRGQNTGAQNLLSGPIAGTAAGVPEPSTMLLIVTGLVGLVGFGRKFGN